jgi:hypothetical protein
MVVLSMLHVPLLPMLINRFCLPSSRELLELVKYNAVSFVKAVIEDGRIDNGTGHTSKWIPQLFLEPGISYRWLLKI